VVDGIGGPAAELQVRDVRSGNVIYKEVLALSDFMPAPHIIVRDSDGATLLDAWAGPYPTGPEYLQRWQAASSAYPDRAETWYWLGDAYYHNGLLVGLDDPLRLAAEAFQRGSAIDSTNGTYSPARERSIIVAEPLMHMVEIAQMKGDTASVRRLVALGLAADSTGGWYLRWQRAVALGDSIQRAFWADSQSISPWALQAIGRFITWTGLGSQDLALATRLDTRNVESGHPGAVSSYHALALLNGGRPGEARRILCIDDTSTEDLLCRIGDALYWGGDTTAAAEAVRHLAPYAAGVARLEVGRLRLRTICVLAAWHAAHADYGYAEAAIRRLREASVRLASQDSLSLTQHTALCAAVLDAIRASALRLPDARAKLAQADSAARTDILLPWLAANLVVARVAEAQGDLALALRAVRRRGAVFGEFPWYLSTFLREEGRLAALTGDTAGAIRAYQHYLALRPNPEPEVKPEVERVREELARLVGERLRSR
jgi:tetratricopeptide (TPR) repeat protein